MTAVLPATSTNPFVGPRSFQAGEELFGRVRETRRIVDLLVAERIVLLYSPSGAGKTSLINAALVPALEDEHFQVSPALRVGLVAHELVPELAGHNRYVLSVLQSLEQGLPPEEQRNLRHLADLGFEGYLQEWALRDEAGAGNELLVFDQFEEILTADPSDEEGRRRFFTELGQVLKDRGRWALFAMREDYLAALDPYVAMLPTKLRTRVRLDLLGDAAATVAIQQPARRAGRPFTEAAARRLVEELRLMHVQRGADRLQVPGPFVEPVQLQVVCRRIWESLAPGVEQIDVEHVEAAGDVGTALSDYYARAVSQVSTRTATSERLLRDWFDEDLITPDGFRTQVPHGPRGLGAAEGTVLRLLEDAHVIRAERRRGTRWMELSHDRLVEPVRADNARWRTEHLSPLQRHAASWQASGRHEGLLLVGPAMDEAAAWVRANGEGMSDLDRSFWEACLAAQDVRRQHRRTRWITVAAAVLLLALTGASVAVYLVHQQAQESQSRALAMQSLSVQARDPLQAVETALAALGRARTPEAEQALRRGLAALRLTSVRSDHGDGLKAASFIGDDSRVLTAGADGRALLRTADDGRALASFSHHEGAQVFKAAASADGSRILTLSHWQARLWDVDDPDAAVLDVAPVDKGSYLTGDISADGERIVTAGAEGAVTVHGTAAGGPTSLVGHTGPVGVASFSPDNAGAFVLTGGNDRTVRIWSSTTGREAAVVRLEHDVSSADFSPAGDVVAIGDAEGGLHLWRWKEQTPPTVVRAHEQGVAAIDFDPQGGRVATAAGKLVRTFRVADGAALVDAEGHTDWIYSVAFDDQGGRLISASADGSALVWDATSGTRVDALLGHTDGVVTAQFDRDGERVVTASIDGTVRLWTPLADVTAMSGGRPERWMNAADFSSDDQHVVGADSEGVVRVWEASSGKELARLAASEDDLRSTAFHAGGQHVFAASYAELSVWDWQAGKELARRRGGLPRAAVTPDGRTIAASDPTNSRVVQLWTWDDRQDNEVTLSSHGADVIAADFSADGRWVATGGFDKRVHVSDVATGKRLAVLDVQGEVSAVDFSADGRRLVSVSGEAARVWDWAAQELLMVLPAAEWRIAAAAFSPDGRQVVTGDVGGTTSVWDARSGQQLASFRRHSEYVNSVRLSSDGKRILTASDDGTARSYGCPVCLPLDELIAQAERRVDAVG